MARRVVSDSCRGSLRSHRIPLISLVEEAIIFPDHLACFLNLLGQGGPVSSISVHWSCDYCGGAGQIYRASIFCVCNLLFPASDVRSI